MNEIVVAWWGFIVPAAIQATALILLVAVVDRVLPRRTWPEVRSALWTLVLIKLVLPPWLASPLALAAWLPESNLAGRLVAALNPARTGQAPSWAALPVAAWLIGLALLAGGGAIRYVRLRRRWLAAAEAPPPWLVELATSAARRVGLGRPIPIVVTGAVQTPFVAGPLSPTIFLPRALVRDLSAEALDHVLLHEAMHVRRRDGLRSTAGVLVQLVYWFHPLVWSVNVRLGALREQCCDRAVGRHLRQGAEAYRRTILVLAARLAGEPGVPGLPFVVPRSSLAARLAVIRDGPAAPGWMRRAASTTVLVLALAGVVPMARAGERVAHHVAEWVDRPTGCLQLRYLVLGRLAESAPPEADSMEDRP